MEHEVKTCFTLAQQFSHELRSSKQTLAFIDKEVEHFSFTKWLVSDKETADYHRHLKNKREVLDQNVSLFEKVVDDVSNLPFRLAVLENVEDTEKLMAVKKVNRILVNVVESLHFMKNYPLNWFSMHKDALTDNSDEFEYVLGFLGAAVGGVLSYVKATDWAAKLGEQAFKARDILNRVESRNEESFPQYQFLTTGDMVPSASFPTHSMPDETEDYRDLVLLKENSASEATKSIWPKTIIGATIGFTAAVIIGGVVLYFYHQNQKLKEDLETMKKKYYRCRDLLIVKILHK